MGKTLIIAALAGISLLTSCVENDSTQFSLFSQKSAFLSTQSMALIGAAEIIDKHPESVDVLQKVADKFRSFSSNVSLTKTDVLSMIEKVVLDSKLKSKMEVLLGVNIIINDVFEDELIDLSRYKQTFIDIAYGIEEAIKFAQLTNDKVVIEK